MKKTLSIIAIASVIAMGCKAQTTESPYHAIVATDGSGQYKTVQAAIDAVPEGRTTPWLILVKNGSYNEQVIVPKNKPYIHLIGQDKEKTIIHLTLNVGGAPNGTESKGKIAYWESSVHNPKSPTYKHEGAVVHISGKNFYTENISYVNDFGVLAENGPQALAMSSQADCAAFYNCKFRSFQDTWMTSTNDTCRHYVKNCWIEGAVDYFYGGGDVLVENSTFYNVRSGSVIVAPCHKNVRYGYVMRNCIVDGNELAADGKQTLGRPWHDNPRTVFINTTMMIPINPVGWNNMGTVPALFAEYGSQDIRGNLLDLSNRRTTYEYTDRNTKEKFTGSCRATITKEEADTYTYENMIPGHDGWNPRNMMKQLPKPRQIAYNDGVFTWQPVKEAIGYVVMDGDQIIGTTTETRLSVERVNHALKVCAVNQYGGLGLRAIL